MGSCNCHLLAFQTERGRLGGGRVLEMFDPMCLTHVYHVWALDVKPFPMATLNSQNLWVGKAKAN